jgi:DNA helicase HerA-like ATPase
MRPNPKLKIEQAITELGVGEALVSLLDEKGRPTVTERAFIVPPGSQLGPLSAAERQQLIAASPIAGHYEKLVDRESAYEKLKARAQESGAAAPSGAPGAPAPAGDAGKPASNPLMELLFGRTGPRGGQHDGLAQTLAKSTVRTIGSTVGREIIRGVLGSILGKRR